jgi:hypothetical protein
MDGAESAPAGVQPNTVVTMPAGISVGLHDAVENGTDIAKFSIAREGGDRFGHSSNEVVATQKLEQAPVNDGADLDPGNEGLDFRFELVLLQGFEILGEGHRAHV